MESPGRNALTLAVSLAAHGVVDVKDRADVEADGLMLSPVSGQVEETSLAVADGELSTSGAPRARARTQPSYAGD